MVVVGKDGFQSERAGALVDLIVDEGEFPLAKLDAIILIIGEHGQLTLTHGLRDLDQIVLRQGKK
jgi:hypothetical protein